MHLGPAGDGPRRGRHTLAIASAVLATLVVVACTKMVKQDLATGPDGKQKGAKPFKIEDNEGHTKGVVTYPGGDRIDWRSVAMPDGKAGSLELRLKWTPPRPGLQLGFDVFDAGNSLVASVKVPRKRSTATSRTLTIENASGAYTIRIYAAGRADAGTYKLSATFTEGTGGGVDLGTMEVPDPPKLPAVPAPAAVCDEFNWDQKNPACKNVCPASGAPPGWPACNGKCPTPPDINNQACWATMPCPNPPDRRLKLCPLSAWPDCDLAHKDPGNPKCDNAKAKPIMGKLKDAQATSDGVIVTINRGSLKGVDKGWRGRFLVAGTTKTLPGGEFEVTRVGKDTCVGRVRLTSDTVQANPDVELTPP